MKKKKNCCHDPEALQRTLCWFFSLHSRFRAREEIWKLCWGDLELQIDPETGRAEILVWLSERESQTSQGLEGSHQRHFNPKILATGREQCPVRYFKIFESHRPAKAKTPTSPFFLAINHNAWRTKSTWYKVSPLSKNQIGQFLRKQPKKLTCKPVEGNFPTIRYENRASLVYLTLVFQRMSSHS